MPLAIGVIGVREVDDEIEPLQYLSVDEKKQKIKGRISPQKSQRLLFPCRKRLLRSCPLPLSVATRRVQDWNKHGKGPVLFRRLASQSMRHTKNVVFDCETNGESSAAVCMYHPPGPGSSRRCVCVLIARPVPSRPLPACPSRGSAPFGDENENPTTKISKVRPAEARSHGQDPVPGQPVPQDQR